MKKKASKTGKPRQGRRSEKMAFLAKLAPGLIHEINNPVAVISAAAQFLEKSAEKGRLSGDMDREDFTLILGKIRKSADKISNILESFLFYSRAGNVQCEALDAGALVETTLASANVMPLLSTVGVTSQLRKGKLAINGDGKKLARIFRNVIENAAEAMGEGGRLLVKTGRRKGMALIEFEDSGEGIAGENLGSVFDPFFSTKKGKAGLGLSECRAVADAHGGSVDIKSRGKGRGTKVVISLPLSR